jgi:hypothetical protein
MENSTLYWGVVFHNLSTVSGCIPLLIFYDHREIDDDGDDVW